MYVKSLINDIITPLFTKVSLTSDRGKTHSASARRRVGDRFESRPYTAS